MPYFPPFFFPNQTFFYIKGQFWSWLVEVVLSPSPFATCFTLWQRDNTPILKTSSTYLYMFQAHNVSMGDSYVFFIAAHPPTPILPNVPPPLSLFLCVKHSRPGSWVLLFGIELLDRDSKKSRFVHHTFTPQEEIKVINVFLLLLFGWRKNCRVGGLKKMNDNKNSDQTIVVNYQIFGDVKSIMNKQISF